jgi:hypothetical protein
LSIGERKRQFHFRGPERIGHDRYIMNDRDLMTLYAGVCFTYNREGRMLQTNDPITSARRQHLLRAESRGHGTTGVSMVQRASVP